MKANSYQFLEDKAGSRSSGAGGGAYRGGSRTGIEFELRLETEDWSVVEGESLPAPWEQADSRGSGAGGDAYRRGTLPESELLYAGEGYRMFTKRCS